MYSVAEYTDWENIKSRYRRIKKLLRAYKTEINPTEE